MNVTNVRVGFRLPVGTITKLALYKHVFGITGGFFFYYGVVSTDT